jgi:DNA-binding NtrC family response regulator
LTDTAQQFLDQHAVRCLQKPVSVEQLDAEIARLCAVSEHPSPA